MATQCGMIDQSRLHEKAQIMAYPDEKAAALYAARSLHQRPETVVDPAFTSGDPFFDARDLVQVKYEMLRRVAVDGATVRAAATAFGFSRPSFYAARAAWSTAGLPGLLPDRPGPRQGHKLTADVLAFLQEQRARDAQVRPRALVALVHERFGVRVHPRSIERALVRLEKKAPRRRT
jgi:transposase